MEGQVLVNIPAKKGIRLRLLLECLLGRSFRLYILIPWCEI
jgi:hypothetical protein